MPATDAELQDLYTRYAHVLHHRARGILGTDEEADDAVQETFARVIRHWDQFRGASSPLTWMWQISTHWCLNRLRARRGHDRAHSTRADEISPSAAADPPAESGLDAQALRALLHGEDDETRAIVIHLYVDELTREDTARLVGISVPTLRKRHDAFLKRARLRLGVSLVAAAGLVLALLLVSR